jgi:hypothetical protein
VCFGWWWLVLVGVWLALVGVCLVLVGFGYSFHIPPHSYGFHMISY